MKKKETQLIPHPEWVGGIDFNKPEPDPCLKLNKGTLTQIANAYDSHAFLDAEGVLWILGNKLNIVLRTSTTIAKFIVDGISDDDKTIIESKAFVRGAEINSQITREIEKSGLNDRGHYLRFSEGCLNNIRDSYTAKAIRGEAEERYNKELSRLKSKRINNFNIKHDELTGELLVKKTSEFSHIRSKKVFKQFALYIENGLIVNKGTHDQITKEGIIDENQLQFFCEQKGWKTDWYNYYIDFLRETYNENED
ncbi:hypothetical protein SLL00_04885 [Metabacillus indicus]|uniref:hypothetical protein n=1 Tax=Metabacillus indicus TaxID=246786 RepID=UPI002A0A0940|nr:hypothetical protein [Metabacillus indicus]MDX8289112.1 hypothetical protein [Metabacillus indicus]